MLAFFVLITVAYVPCNGDFSYPSFKRITINDIALVGDTFINKSVPCVQLTTHYFFPTHFSSINSFGAMVYPSPIHLFDISQNRPSSYKSYFSFSISRNNSHSGEGFSFFISLNVPSQTHPFVTIFGLHKTFFCGCVWSTFRIFFLNFNISKQFTCSSSDIHIYWWSICGSQEYWSHILFLDRI